MAEKLDTPDVDRRTAVATDSGPARIVTARRRLMLGAAAVLPSIVTLPAGAQRAMQSVNCARQIEIDVVRFSIAPDEWLRKKVFSGRLASNGRPAYCTTWDQPSILAIATLETKVSGLGYKALKGTTWSDGSESFKIGEGCPPAMTQVAGGPSSYCYSETVDNISPDAEVYALVYVDQTGLNYSLEPGPGMSPVREKCWASLLGAGGSSLG